MVEFIATIQKFGDNKDKSGWTYVEVPIDIAQLLKPGNKREFKAKGKLDSFAAARLSVMPAGGGKFIIPLNAAIRKGIGKKHGAMLQLKLTEDKSVFVFNKDFIECLADEPIAQAFFNTLTPSHQRYFSKWIEDAKTIETKTRRITRAINALSKKWGYGEMLREQKPG